MPYETGMDIEKIRANVAARDAFNELMTFLQDVLKYKPAEEERVLRIMAEECAAKLGKVLVDDGPTFRMSEKESEHFEQEIVPYGTFKGKKVGELPLSYIFIITEGTFTRQLLRYVRSKRFLDRQ